MARATTGRMKVAQAAGEAGRSLAQEAFERLRADIVSCRLLPGERLTERPLAEELGLGLTPVREALTRLRHEGLVTASPRRGYQVTPLTLKSVDDIFVLWRIVAPDLVRLGFENGSDEDLARVGAVFDAQQDLPSSSDADLRRIESSHEMFELLAEAGGNSALIALFRRIEGEMHRVWAMVVDSEHDSPAQSVDTTAWHDLLSRRDGEGAAELTRAFLAVSHARARNVLTRWPSVVDSEVVPRQDRLRAFS
jgi:DNA-binding GntR family transcriptional regulator